MTFLSFSLLFGTLLVAVPIVLHLVMRQKPQRFEFPALRFIQKRHEANRRRLRLRHLLLLLLRAGAIALLAFALARPRLTASSVLPSQEAPVAAVLIFDTAPRMEYRQENQTRLEVAKNIGLWLLSQFSQESQVAVLDSRLGQGVFQPDVGAAKDRIVKLDIVSNAQPLTAMIDEALRLLAESDAEKKEPMRKEVYVFTDLARSAWPTQAAAQLQQRFAEVPDAGCYVIDVGVENPINYALGQVRLSAQVLSNRSTLGLQTQLSRTGASAGSSPEMRTVELYLVDENRQPKKRSEQNIAIEPGQSRQLDFRVGALAVGTHQGFLRLVGQDGLACDDTRNFTVAVKPAWHVLVAAPKPATRYALFLTEAVAPTEFRKSGQARFDCDIADLSELADRALEDYAAVCLLDPGPLEPAVWQKLVNFVSAGGGLAIFLGRNARVDAFNESLPQQLLAGKLLRQAWRPDGDCYLAPRDYQHPILSAFRSQAGSIPWEDFPVFQYWELDKAPERVNVVLRWNDDRPALLERPLGNGRTLTMTSPISDQPSGKPWNLLPMGLHGDDAGVFVILANQIVEYLVGSTEQQLNYLAGDPVVLPLVPGAQHGAYLVTGPGDFSYTASAELEKNQLEISREIEQPGNYRVQAGGTASGVDLGFSMNLAPQQTDLQRLEAGGLDEIFGKVPYRIARSRDEIDRDITIGTAGAELFPAAILIVALLLLAEYVVANRFYKEGTGNREQGIGNRG
jgi:hypothetical protein